MIYKIKLILLNILRFLSVTKCLLLFLSVSCPKSDLSFSSASWMYPPAIWGSHLLRKHFPSGHRYNHPDSFHWLTIGVLSTGENGGRQQPPNHFSLLLSVSLGCHLVRITHIQCNNMNFSWALWKLKLIEIPEVLQKWLGVEWGEERKALQREWRSRLR